MSFLYILVFALAVFVLQQTVYPFITLVVHESGHYLATRLVRARATHLTIGSGPTLVRFLMTHPRVIVTVRTTMDQGHVRIRTRGTSPLQQAFIDAGGFLAEALLYGTFVVIWFHSAYLYLNAFLFCYLAFSSTSLIVGLTSATSDGRSFWANIAKARQKKSEKPVEAH